jgi:hypothetical protein
MIKIKYIKTESNEIITFPASLNHSDFRMFKPVSAGFISFGYKGDVSCYGDSFSLKLKADPEDSDIAKRQFFPY